MRTFIYIFVFLFSFGCVSQMAKSQANKTNGPPVYKSGFEDGCNTGYVGAGHPYATFKKDVMRYSKDELYKQGWEDGFRICKGGYDAITHGGR